MSEAGPDHAGALSVGVLGPLLVSVGGRAVEVTGSRLRALLLRLAVEPGRPVSIGELAAAVWGDDLPADPANALQSLVSRLRRSLKAPTSLTQQPSGYRLELSGTGLDAQRFLDLVTAARARLRSSAEAPPDLSAAGTTLAEALSLWRGPALVDAGDADYVSPYVARWDEVRLSARSDLIEIALRQGRGADMVSELEELVEAHPLREAFTAQLMTALASSGRVAEALQRYEDTRQLLAERLGTDPGLDLQQLHLRLLRGEAGPAAAPERRRSNLRVPLTSFVGRTDELSRVSALLGSSRLTTIVGPGGAGKTRLAVEAARSWMEDHDESAWLVELAPVTSEANVAPAFIGALGVRDVRLLDRSERIQQSDTERLVDTLADSRCLLVIDNCEHLVEVVARLVDEILGRAPGVRVLTTSREPLALTGESLCPLHPLGLPTVGTSAELAPLIPAVRLWLDRAQAVSPGFTLSPATVGDVTEIVRRLDGLPLAIELAAARLRVLPLTEIRSRLSDRFRLLTGGNRTSLPRHRTLRAVVEWSWDLLQPAERLLAERLAVFPAGASVATAVAVCADSRLPGEEIPELLSSLVDKSLLEALDTRPIRYRMLETIREYGVERLAERGEIHQVRTAHADHFAGLAARLEPGLHDSRQLDALAELNAERENILAALRYYGDSGRSGDAVILALALVWYWSLLGSSSECVAWLTFVIEAHQGHEHPQLVHARAARAVAAAQSNESVVEWSRLQDECAAVLADLSGAAPPAFASLAALRPILAMFAGRPEPDSQTVAEVEPDRWVGAATHAWAANLAENDGDLEALARETDLAHAEFTALGDRWGLSNVLTARAHLLTLRGELDAAVDDYTTALRYVSELGSTEDDRYLRLRLAELCLRRGDTAAARGQLGQLRRSGGGGMTLADPELFADSVLVAILMEEGEPEAAVALAADLRRRISVSTPVPLLEGHALSVILAATAIVSAEAGDAETALADVVAAYPQAVASTDMPILATVGVAVAHVACVRCQHRLAAVALGAAAQVRGGEDPSDGRVSRVRDRLRRALGQGYDDAYASGLALSRAEAIARLDPALLTADRPAAATAR